MMAMKQSDFEKAKEDGLLGCSEDPFWNPRTRTHECCGSKTVWKHKVGCAACGDGYDPEGKGEQLPKLSVPKLKSGAWRIEEERAAAMYSLYREGGPDGKPLSLSEIGTLYRKSRQAVYDIFHARGWPLRSRTFSEPRIIDGVAYRPDSQGYLRGTKDGKRIYAHKEAWKAAFGAIPEDSVISFRDGFKDNVEISNLVLVKKAEMAIRFNPEKRRDDRKSWATRKKRMRQRKARQRLPDEDNEDFI